ncbi:MAG TPA: fumarylacetoacetate hydrolase family protein [Methylomirabilota bacterium]|jgi:2-keto-4-pentenoate hydratase/2-oxohepta-3-ene-1,7-dioic acid hydratase in catechol pathway
MRIVRFRAGGKTRYGVLEGTHIVEYAGTPYASFKKARKKYLLRQAVLLAPVVPSKIVAVGLNYRDHAEEMNVPVPLEPVIFLKPLSALCGPDDPIVFPAHVLRVDYEGELAVVMKKRCHLVAAERAREYVLGYTCLNDVTARDLQARDGQPTRAKAFDSFCPVGPCIATDIDPNGVDIETYVNGERRQASNTKHLICPVEDLVARVSAVMTLLPGDVIATGTPGGVGPLHPGDKVEVRIESIGGLKNPVIRIQENHA